MTLPRLILWAHWTRTHPLRVMQTLLKDSLNHLSKRLQIQTLHPVLETKCPTESEELLFYPHQSHSWQWHREIDPPSWGWTPCGLGHCMLQTPSVLYNLALEMHSGLAHFWYIWTFHSFQYYLIQGCRNFGPWLISSSNSPASLLRSYILCCPRTVSYTTCIYHPCSGDNVYRLV